MSTKVIVRCYVLAVKQGACVLLSGKHRIVCSMVDYNTLAIYLCAVLLMVSGLVGLWKLFAGRIALAYWRHQWNQGKITFTVHNYEGSVSRWRK